MLPVLFSQPPILRTYTKKVLALFPIAYWPMAEASGTVSTDESGNGRAGAYSNVTLGATGIGDGRTAAQFVAASSSFNNIYSASLAAAYNGQELTVAGWAQVSGSGVWTDATLREIFRLLSDGNNHLFFRRTATNNQLGWTYKAGGTGLSGTATLSVTTWFHWAITASKSGDALKVYINGVQSGATQTGLGTYVNALNSAQSVIGADTTTPTEKWSGNIAHVAIWTSPLSAAQIAILATVP